MTHPRADVALLVDFTDLRDTLCPSATEPETGTEGQEGEAAARAGPLADAQEAGRVARQLVRYASTVGRLAISRAYGDWGRCPELATALHAARLDPVLVLASEEGEDRSHIRLVCEALEAQYTGDEPDAYVLVTGDPTLVPLLQSLRADGSEVIVVAPEHAAGREIRDAADHFVSLEDVLKGAEGEPPQLRTRRSSRGGEDRGRGARGDDARRSRTPHPTPVYEEGDFEKYDWTPFIRLIDELEHRLPFVGVRYLVNKVLGGHNCGVEDPRLRRDLINRAVDLHLLEMYPVGNVGDRADPVTACRLDRKSELVVATIGDTVTPEGPEEQHHDDGGIGNGSRSTVRHGLALGE